MSDVLKIAGVGLAAFAIWQFIKKNPIGASSENVEARQAAITARTDIRQDEKTARTQIRNDTVRDAVNSIFKPSSSTKTISSKSLGSRKKVNDISIVQPAPVPVKSSDPPFIRETANFTPASGGSAFVPAPKVTVKPRTQTQTTSNTRSRFLKGAKSALRGTSTGAAVRIGRRLIKSIRG